MSNDLHTIFDTAVGKTISWLSAALGLGSFAGVVSTTVGVLSAVWLTAQLVNYFKYTLPKNKWDEAERKRITQEREEAGE